MLTLPFIRKTLVKLGNWEPKPLEKSASPSREKRFLDILAGIGSIVNAVQIKKIKKNIKILQAQNILQDQKIDELARYMNLTATRVRLHDKQIYNLQVHMVRVRTGVTRVDRYYQLPHLCHPSDRYGPIRGAQAPIRIGDSGGERRKSTRIPAGHGHSESFPCGHPTSGPKGLNEAHPL